jgi:hypothetical protein
MAHVEIVIVPLEKAGGGPQKTTDLGAVAIQSSSLVVQKAKEITSLP